MDRDKTGPGESSTQLRMVIRAQPTTEPSKSRAATYCRTLGPAHGYNSGLLGKVAYGVFSKSGSNKVNALQVAGLALLLAVTVALVYRAAPGNEFHFDDYRNIADFGPVRMEQLDGEALLRAFTQPKLD